MMGTGIEGWGRVLFTSSPFQPFGLGEFESFARSALVNRRAVLHLAWFQIYRAL
jgi:hypothetical protein